MTKLKEKTREAYTAVLPITVIVLLLGTLVVPMEVGTISMFIVGALLLIIGMGFFSLGADMAMIPMGEGLGVQFSKTKKLGLVVLLSFIMGTIITIAEPDLQVLAGQVPSIPSNILIWAVAIGVGIFLALAILRILFRLNFSVIVMILYAILFIVAALVPENFLPVAFDSGGVTTGPITVPFIMAMGVGLASVRSDKHAADDSFGLVAMSSIGPILAVMLLGIFYNPSEAVYTPVIVPEVATTRDVLQEFAAALPNYAVEVGSALLPIIAVFILYQLIVRRYKRRELVRIGIGFVYTAIGLILFLTGVSVGFMPVGHLFGSQLASSMSWLLVPLGMLIGYFIVAAEPAVQVLNVQVEEVTDGAISRKAMNLCLSIGVAISVGLSMVRVLTGISIFWLLIPGYAIAITLAFFVPKIFVGIAFDSGGVASGPMTTTFLLPLAMGACEAVGGNVMTDAFGVVAMVAMTPLIAIQIMGLVYGIKSKKAEAAEAAGISAEEDDAIIEYEGKDLLANQQAVFDAAEKPEEKKEESMDKSKLAQPAPEAEENDIILFEEEAQHA